MFLTRWSDLDYTLSDALMVIVLLYSWFVCINILYKVFQCLYSCCYMILFFIFIHYTYLTWDVRQITKNHDCVWAFDTKRVQHGFPPRQDGHGFQRQKTNDRDSQIKHLILILQLSVTRLTDASAASQTVYSVYLWWQPAVCPDCQWASKVFR